MGVLLVVIAIPTGEKQYEEEYGTEIEIRLETILEKMEGVGEVKVMVTYQDNDEVEGIAVVAEGGGDAVIVKNITEVNRQGQRRNSIYGIFLLKGIYG